jgi:hypothetical protein
MRQRNFHTISSKVLAGAEQSDSLNISLHRERTREHTRKLFRLTKGEFSSYFLCLLPSLALKGVSTIVAVDLVLADRAALAHLLDFSLGKFYSAPCVYTRCIPARHPDSFNYKIAMQLLRALS